MSANQKSESNQKKVRCSYCNRTMSEDNVYSRYDIMSTLKKLCPDKNVNTRIQCFCSMECEIFFKIKSYTVADIGKEQITDLLINDFPYSEDEIRKFVDEYFMEK